MAAIGSRKLGASAMARRSTAELGLGFALGAEEQSEGERENRGRGERSASGSLSIPRGGSGRSETRREARATARVATAAGEEDDRGVFHGAPWTFRWPKQLGPFPSSFCFLFKTFSNSIN